ncbi:MAG: polymer-forming cytoskeletal protein [Caulobacteraceae bacterium]|nr:polymer-forming cytoskeletal protein [Caulobacteraceae bacterium]
MTPALADARKAPSLASLIASDIAIQGNVVGEGDLHVDGLIRGNVSVPRLSIGESGRIEGDIEAEVVETRGHITGAVNAHQVRLAASSHVEGDITHEELTIETGAYFQGRSLKRQARLEAPTEG